jgi:hypothetical protein
MFSPPGASSVRGLWQFPLGNELVIVRPGVEGLFLLNSTARLLWEERNRGASSEEAVRTFVNVFGLSAAVARRDIEAMLAQWSAGMLAPGKTCNPLDNDMSVEVFRGLDGRRDAVRFDCVLNGRAFRVILEPGDLVEEIAPRLARVCIPVLPAGPPVSTFTLANGTDRVFVYRDGICIAQEEKTAGARAILLQEMTRLCDTDRGLQAILHAGACGTGDACVLLAGASHAGKSTLCAALMAQGLYCYSDDSAVIDRAFRVAGMPFPLTLRQSSWPVLESRLASVEGTGMHRRAGAEVCFLPSNLPAGASPAARVKALVFVEYQPEAMTVLRSLTPFDALLVLQRSGFWIEHDRESVARFLGWLALLPIYGLTYSSIDEAVGAVQDLLA